LEKDAEKTLKQEQREKLNPSLGRMDIDYQVLHDAFFKYQTKPKMTGFGDLYYEGKEYEVEMKEKRPGVLSKELKESLGMPDGAPPPWLINMQRAGPPPSYPHLKIPGLNAPIPPGAEYGYHPGGWGRPPVDEYNKPLYGDAYGEEEPPKPTHYVEIAHWGRLPSEEEVSSEEEQAEADQEEEGRKEADVDMEHDVDISGIETPLSGLETPQNMESNIRKPRKDDTERELYQVLEEKEVSVGSAVFGSNRQYVIDKAKKPKGTDRVELMKSQKTEGIELSLDPNELEKITEEGLKKRYDKAVQEKKDKESKGDDSARKRKRHSDSKKSKKYKDFKF
jgi:splicing factor 3B subunit 2